MNQEIETKLRRGCAISLLSYIYGEPYDLMRLGKSNLLQFTQYDIKLDFTKSIGEQIQQSLANYTTNQLLKIVYRMDDYNTSLFQSIANDVYFNDLYLEFNIQNKLGGECYVFSRNNDIIISFRGSDTPLDLLIDATIETIPLVGNLRFPYDPSLYREPTVEAQNPPLREQEGRQSSRIHKGFFCQLTNYGFHNQLAKIVDTFIERTDKPITIQIIGHSLGSALGYLFAYYLHHHLNKSLTDKIGTDGFPNIELLTNGSPPVGNSEWVSDFNRIFVNDGKRNHYRLINERDIVPNAHIYGYKLLDTIPLIRMIASEIPPQTTSFVARYINTELFDYCHCGTETYIIIDNILRRVDKAITTDPTIYDLLNIANTHMIDYQRWIR